MILKYMIVGIAPKFESGMILMETLDDSDADKGELVKRVSKKLYPRYEFEYFELFYESPCTENDVVWLWVAAFDGNFKGISPKYCYVLTDGRMLKTR